MNNPRALFGSEAKTLVIDAFDSGALAVLAAIYGNQPLHDVGLTGLSDEHMERVRYLRQKIHGAKAYDYKPKRKRPPKWTAGRGRGLTR